MDTLMVYEAVMDSTMFGSDSFDWGNLIFLFPPLLIGFVLIMGKSIRNNG